MKSFVYETMYILRPDLTEEQVEQLITKHRDLLQEQGGQNIKVQNLGKRRLAYDIQKHREGTYIQMNYEGPGQQIAVLERAMRLSEEVIRYLTIKNEVTVEKAPSVEPELELQET